MTKAKDKTFCINDKLIQLVIVIGLILMMGVTLFIDGAFGERVFGILIGTFGFCMGYYFNKANSKPPTVPAPNQ